MWRLPLGLALIPLGALAAEAHSSHGTGQKMEAPQTEHLMPPDVTVTDRQGASHGFVSLLAGRGPVIVSFMYTRCDSVCDITNGVLFGVDQMIAETGQKITLVSLSIDPMRDGPAELEKTAGEFGASDRWLWLTAGTRGTGPLLDGLGVAFDSIESHDPMFLVGDFCTGDFTRIVGIPEPDALIALAMKAPGCAAP